MKMDKCRHEWEMTNIQYGFVLFERCFHCSTLRTYFSPEGYASVGEEYREGEHFYNILEKAQTLHFDLRCQKCDKLVTFKDLMGLLYCTGCLPDCEVEKMQKKLEAGKTWVIVAFGHLPEAIEKPVSPQKLDILTDYFNQRRDTSRSRIKIVSNSLITDISLCRGEFIHDVGMLSQEPPRERKPIF
jgi:hypothetical protein